MSASDLWRAAVHPGARKWVLLLGPVAASGCADVGLTPDALLNGTYQIDGSTVQLTGGEYRAIAADESASAADVDGAPTRVVALHSVVALGDLGGDDGRDAAAVLIDDMGPDGVTHHLAALVHREGGYVNVATVPLRRCVHLTHVWINDVTHIIAVRVRGLYVDPASGEPTVVVGTTGYLLTGGMLSPVRSMLGGALPRAAAGWRPAHTRR